MGAYLYHGCLFISWVLIYIMGAYLYHGCLCYVTGVFVGTLEL